jgi:hypothetical protein
MKHTINTTTKEGDNMRIQIRLDDDCKNGHEDFAITADIWQKDCPRTDRYFISGGCCHEEILKARPDLQIFVNLHLSDSHGAPMFAIENGFYHLENSAIETARDYIRCTDEEIQLIKKVCKDKIYFQYMLEKLGIPARWKNQANDAIKKLEEMTGGPYTDGTTKRQYVPMGEKFAEVDKLVNEGFYSDAAIDARETEKKETAKAKKLTELEGDRDKTIKRANDEFAIKRAVLLAGLPLDSFIYYDHTNEGKFNWGSWGKKITQDQLDAFVKGLDLSELPAGITFKLDTSK